MPNSAGGFAWGVDDWTRLRRFLILGSRGRQLLRGRVRAHARERRRRRALPEGGRCAHGRGDRRGQPGWPGAEERPGAVRAGRVRGPRRRAHASGGARRAAGGLPDWNAPVPVREVRRGLPRLGPLAASSGRRLVRGAGRSDALAYQAVKYRQRDGMTHRDLLRLAHPGGSVSARNPDARGLRRARGAVRVDRPWRSHRWPAADRRGLRRAPRPRRTPARERRARARVPPAA